MNNKEQIKNIMKNEKNLYIWKKGEFICIIKRFRGHLNGYVGVNLTNKLYGKSAYYTDEILSEIEKFINGIEVHGGLTFADNGNVFHLEIEGYNLEDYWFFGFDTDHLGDNYIDMESGYDSIDFLEKGTYKDYNYVKNEVDSLIKQFSSI